MERTYRIAGVTVNMDTWGIIGHHAIPYEIEYTDTPDLIVSSERARKEFGYKGGHPAATFREYTGTAVCFYNELLKFDGMVIHSSAVMIDGKAYLVSADSGTGKSTHTSLYRRVYGDERVRILNDDKPAVRRENGEFFVYGTPWSGRTDLNLNLKVPIGGICILRRGTENKIRKMSQKEAIYALLRQTIRATEPERLGKLMELISDLLKKVNVWEMHCNIEPEAAIVSYETMSGIRKEETI